MVLKHKTEAALASFNAAVAPHEHARVMEALNTFLSPSAQVKLEVTFPSALKQNAPAVIQDFNREQFVAFIDNVIYALKTYSF